MLADCYLHMIIYPLDTSTHVTFFRHIYRNRLHKYSRWDPLPTKNFLKHPRRNERRQDKNNTDEPKHWWRRHLKWAAPAKQTFSLGYGWRIVATSIHFVPIARVFGLLFHRSWNRITRSRIREHPKILQRHKRSLPDVAQAESDADHRTWDKKNLREWRLKYD